MQKRMAIKEHLDNNKAFALDGRGGTMLAVVATELGMEESREFPPAHAPVLPAGAGPSACSSNPSAVMPWHKFLTCAVLGLVLGVLSTVLTVDMADIRQGGNFARVISHL